MSLDQQLPIKVYPGRKRHPMFARGSVLTIGAFDGVHLGHQKVIEALKLEAEKRDLPSAVMMFRPSPAQFFSGNASAELMSWRERVLAIKATGVDAVVCMPFDRRVSQLSAETFVDELLSQLGIRFLMVGDDFQFGVARRGNYELLCELGKSQNFEVRQSDTHCLDNERISSTRIRRCLAEGDLPQAKRLLGRDYQIRGRVVAGKKLGRQLGFPTANIPLKRAKVAIKGVFAVIVTMPSGERVQGVANLGTRPAVNSLEQPLLEVHLLDWQGDLYGQELRVDFKARLRDEMSFGSLDALKQAIQKDEYEARDWFSKNSSTDELN